MGLDMSLDLRPKQDLNLIKEIVRHNRWRYKRKAAQDALSGRLSGFGRLVSSDSFFSEYLPEDQDISLSEIESMIKTEAFQAFKTGKTSTDPKVKKIYDELQEWMMTHAEAVEPGLSDEAIEFLEEHPQHRTMYYSDTNPRGDESVDAAFMEKFSKDWRKENHIHAWFVENVQDGEDDCGDYVVSKEKLVEFCDVLQSAVEAYRQQILDYGEVRFDDDLESILPTKSGFFFGGTDYDEWYNASNEGTLEFVKKALREVDFNKYMFVYSSSW